MVAHLTYPDGRPLCPEAEQRDRMSDAEFWEHVLQPEAATDRYAEDFDIPPEVAAQWEMETRLANPCPECGQVGACAYDADGRALIHVTESED